MVVDGAAGQELTDKRSREAFDSVELLPQILHGIRLRDDRNGMSIPPKLTPKTVLDASYRPERWFNFLTTDSLKLASLSDTSHAADGLIVSNHEGRQLDRAPVTLTSLPEIRTEVGPEVPLILDSAIMSGTDIVAALCAGADLVLIGRAYLYGLMAGGQQGVSRAIELLAVQIRTTMLLMGAGSITDLGPDCMRAPWLCRAV